MNGNYRDRELPGSGIIWNYNKLIGYDVFGNDDIGLDSGYMKADNPNLIVYQVNAELPLEIDVSFMTSSKNFSMFHSSRYP